MTIGTITIIFIIIIIIILNIIMITKKWWKELNSTSYLMFEPIKLTTIIITFIIDMLIAVGGTIYLTYYILENWNTIIL